MGNTTNTPEGTMAAKFELGTTVTYTTAYIRQAEAHNGHIARLHQAGEVTGEVTGVDASGTRFTVAFADESTEVIYVTALRRFIG